jgi:chromosomal replication initiator protein
MLGDLTRPGAIWDTVLTAARLHSDDETFQTMIRLARLDHYDPKSESVVIQIPAGMSKVLFQRKAVPSLEKAFANALGVQPRVFIEENPSLPKTLPQQHGSHGRAFEHAVAVNQAVEPGTVNLPVPGRSAAQQSGAVQTAARHSLNPRYTFSSFVEGPSNRLALAAARRTSEAPGNEYNPLFIHGSVGLGKTHLLQAICQATLERFPTTRLRYLSCEQFVNDYIEALAANRQPAFRKAFRDIDLLVIDDIHFLANKEAMQEEFFHTFNDLYNARKQIIISSDSPPKDIPAMEERLTSRFLWGLPVKIEPPCTETREAIVTNKAAQRNIALSRDVVQFIAGAVRSNIRELEGAVTQVSAMAEMLRMPISLTIAREALKDIVSINSAKRISIDDIVEAVCRQFVVRVADLQSHRRTRSVTLPRQVAMYLCKKMTQKTLSEIGGFFGGRDHTTVLHSIRKIEGEIVKQSDLMQRMEIIERELAMAGR